MPDYPSGAPLNLQFYNAFVEHDSSGRHKDVTPYADNAYDLGLLIRRWRSIYANSLRLERITTPAKIELYGGLGFSNSEIAFSGGLASGKFSIVAAPLDLESLLIRRYDNAGVEQGAPLQIIRNSGLVLLENSLGLRGIRGYGSSDAFVFADWFTGADMGEKITAAIAALAATGGRIIVPPGAHVGAVTVTMAANITIEGTPGATYTANGNYPAFTVPATATNTKFYNIRVNGSNNVANTLNQGITLQAGTLQTTIDGCYFYQCYHGVWCESWYDHRALLIIGCIADGCKYYGFSVAGKGHYLFGKFDSTLIGCKAYNCSTGYNIQYKMEVIGCTATVCGMGFITGAGQYFKFSGCVAELCTIYGFRATATGTGTVTMLNDCHAVSCVIGFYLQAWTAGAWGAVKLTGCTAKDCTTAGFSSADYTDRWVDVEIVGCGTYCAATQAYAFKFYRSVRSLIYTNNNAKGFSTAAEYWEPTLDKSTFEISHNILA